MKKNILILGVLILMPSFLYSATEMATFESFYVKNLTIGWWGWIIAALVASIAGLVVIFFTGGIASPIVLGIGSYIGSLSGLSGIAATNYGLALLGGGSIASGGFGIIGGVALLTASLTFSTEVIIDFAVTKGINTYDKSKMIENSKNILTLPIPVNIDGSKQYKKIIDKLEENINKEELMNSDNNQEVLNNILINNNLSDEDLKDVTLKSYLYFYTYQYNKAKEFAEKSIILAREQEIRRTFPAYIYSISSIYEGNFFKEFDEINNKYFRYSILAEKDNELIPVIFSIYLEHILNNINSRDISEYVSFLEKINVIAFEIENDKYKKAVITTMIVKYYEQIKIEQQKILSLTQTSNKSIKSNPKTLSIIKQAFADYSSLLSILEEISKDKLFYDIDKELKKQKEKVELSILFARYNESKAYLRLLVENFEKDSKMNKNLNSKR